MSNSTMRGELLSNYLSNGDASTWNGGAYGFYSRSTNPCGLTNCTINAVSAYQGGFGLRFANTPAEVRNCTVTVTTTYAYNYGIFTGGTCDLKVYNSNFNCTSGTTYGYGIYAYNGTIYAENCTFDVTTQRTGATSAADCYLYGVNVNTSKTATLNGCTINATGSGQYSNNGYGVYVNGTAEIEDCKVTVSGINSGAYAIGNTSSTTRIGVASGKFKATATSTGVSTNGTAAAAKQQLYGGYYNTNNNLEKYLPAGYGIETLQSSSTEYGEGYRYAVRPSTNLNPVCKIGSTPYYSLEEALEFVNKNSGTAYTILMTANYTLPAGNYILPSNATLLVPYDGQTSAMGTSISSSLRSNTRTTPSVNLKLTFATGANLTAFGVIETGGREYDANGGTQTGGVNGKFGQIALNSGSHIDLEDGSKLQCWGYVTGAGTITAKSGSKAYEHFEFGVNKGGTIMSGLISNNKGVFAVDDYFYQNIEAEITYKPGSEAFASSGMYIQGNRAANGVKIVGASNEHLFKMSTDEVRPNMWVRKKYDPTTDRCTWTLNDGAQFSSINITISGYGMNSSNFVLPIASSMDIVMNYGTLAISSTQKVMLIPGSRMIIKKDATLQIPSGTKFYVWDVEQWNLGEPVAQYVYSAAYQPTRSSTNPRAGILKDKTNLPSGEIYVQGTLEVSGDIQTTTGGAFIHSTNEDAGQIVFKTGATATGTVYQYTKGKNYTASSTTSAKLQNGDGTYEATAGSVTNDKWIYREDKWVKVSTSGCFVVETISGTPHYYAHPKDWVEVTANTPDDHAYHVTADPTRFVIQGADCNWIEVAKEGSDYKCINENSIYYGSYFEWSEGNGYWVEKKVSISFNNQGSVTTYNNIPYKTVPQYAGATPKINATSTEYYTWIGWAKGSTEGEFFAKDADLPEATENTTYYAIFETHKYSYAVVFKNYDGSILQTSSWEAGQVPYYLAETNPVKPATAAKIYTFTGWSPTPSAVTSSGVVYTAQFGESDRTYTVQWVNYNGTVLKEEQVKYNTTPSAPATPTRPNDSYYTYTFDAWSPAISSVTGNQTYTATYNYEKKVTKYSVTFKNGSETIYSQNLVAGSTPVFDGTTPAKAADAQYTYTFDGWATSNGGALAYAKDATLPALSANVTYYAHFATTGNTYTIRWKSVDDKQTYETDTDVPYGTMPSYDGDKPTKARQGATVFTFDGWSATKGGDKIELPNVTGNATYYAHFTDDPVYTVEFDMQGHGSAIAEQEVVENQHVIEPAAPDVAEWIFGGWYKETACTNAWNFSTDVVTANTTLYAKWTQAVATVTANDITENYTSITDAFTAAKAKTNPTIKLLQDVSMGTTTLTYDGANTCTLDLNGHTISGTARILFKVDNASAVFTVTDLTESKLGKLSLSTAPTDKAGYCANLVNGTLKLEAGTFYIRSTSTNQNAVGARVDGGEFIMNGGTVHTVVTVNTRVGHGVQPLGTANAIVNGGTVRVESAGQGYGMYVTGTMTVNGGKFHITAASTAEVVHHDADDPTKLFINGGYYNINTNMAACVPSPYHVLPASLTEDELTYNYKVAEAYMLAWNLDGGMVETAGTAAGLVAYGTSLTAPNVTKVGYTFDKWTPSVPATMPAADAEYTATWTPNTNTAYTVKHYKQNVAGDGYDLAETDNLTGTTGASVTPDRKSYEGFDTPDGQTVTILADGSRVVTYNYTRKSYTLTWETDGDALTGDYTNGSTKFGAAITAPNTPTKTGYTFAGWSPAKAETMPAAATEYTATWTINQYTLTVATNNAEWGTVTGGGLYDYNTAHTITATPKSGFKFVKWNDDNTNASREVTVTADVTFTATFDYDIANYTVKHWQQNIDNDEYTEVVADRQTDLSGTIGTATAAEAKTYTGFDAQPFDQVAIALENTEVNIYYNRKTYTIIWDVKLNGEREAYKKDTLRYGATPSYGDDPTKEQSESQVFTFSGWTPTPYAVDKDQTYTGSFNVAARPYTITFVNDNGSELQSSQVGWGSTPGYSGTPVSTVDALYEFIGWTPAIAVVTGEATYVATYKRTVAPIEVTNGNTEPVSMDTETTKTTIREGGTLSVASGMTLTTDVLILEASASNSGQITGAGNVEVTASTGKAYFDLTLNTAARHWHAFGVPWAVNLTKDPLTEVETGRTLTLGSHYEIVYYDTHTRATQGPGSNCWKYLKHYDQEGQPIDEMTPGKGYMIAFTCSVQTVRFVKKEGAPVIYNGEVTVSAEGEGTNRGINAVANPMAYHANMTLAGVGQVHDGGEIGSDGYDPVTISNMSFIVGKTVYVQVDDEQTLTPTNGISHAVAAAPVRRAPKATNKKYLTLEDYYSVSLTNANGTGTKLYVLPEEDKEDKYVIGHDLVKMGMSTKKPQIWINRYGVNLALNTAAPVNETAEFPVNLYAPTAGEYTINNIQPSAVSDQNDYIVYLTQNGEAIWNLSDAPYVLSLPAGTNKTYGLRLTARKSPTIATGVDEAVVDAKNEIRKVLINDKVFIIRGNNVYSIDGQLVK